MTSLRFAVLLSGTGRTLANFLDQIAKGRLDGEIVAVASNKEGVRGLSIAQQAGIPSAVFRRADYPTRKQRDAAMLDWVCAHGPALITLAGYLALLDLDRAGTTPVLNIHPALLPRFGGKGFYGDRVHAAVLESGDAESGATVHLVSEEYDRGPILAQVRVPVLPGDDVTVLAHRVFEAERELYPDVLRRIAGGEIVIEQGRVWEGGGQARG
jgi:phosphoribosylglycinamide formyltransferase-1